MGWILAMIERYALTVSLAVAALWFALVYAGVGVQA